MSNARGFWTDDRLGQLAQLAAKRMYAADIAREIGCSLHSIVTMAGRNGIAIVRYSPDEQAIVDEQRRQRDRAKKRRKRAARGQTFIPDPSKSKTGPIYRNSLPRAPEMTPNERRAFLAQALRNTAEMAANV
jgi:hypothetical protein